MCVDRLPAKKINGTLAWLLSGLLLLWGISMWAKLTGVYAGANSDYIQDYVSARMALSGSAIYGDDVSSFAEDLLSLEGIENFHPPTSIIFFLPFALLPYSASFWLWNTVSLVLYALTVAMVCRRNGMSKPLSALITAALLLWYPFIFSTALGQSSVVISFLVVGGWYALGSNRQGLGGAMVGMACLFKLFPAFLLVVMAVHRLWRAMLSLLLTVAAGTAAAWAAAGTTAMKHYVSEIARRDVASWGFFPINSSITGMVYPAFVENSWVRPLADDARHADIIILLCSVLLLGLTLHALRVSFHGGQGITPGYGIGCIAMLMLSPITWMHVFIVLLIPLFYLATRQGFLENRMLLWPTFLAFVGFSLPDVYLANVLVDVSQPDKIPYGAFVVLKYAFWALCLLYFALYREMTGRKRMGPER